MTRFADPTVCPDCRTHLPANPATCPRCGLPLQGPLAVSLLSTLTTADRLLAELRATTGSTKLATPGVTTDSTTGTTAGAAGGTTSGEPWTPEPYPASTSPRPGRHGLSAASVPKILLGLGALCLLVAAVTFLAVAWSWLGVGGRTAILVGLTVVAGGLGTWLARRGLRIAGEALTAVALGLLALDVVGADHAGWLGDLSGSGLTVVVGAVLAAAGLALTLGSPARLAVPEVVAALGLWVAVTGVLGLTSHDRVAVAIAVPAFAGLVAVGLAADRTVLARSAAVAGATWWLWLVGAGLAEAADHASLRGLWLEGHGGGLLAAAVLALLPLAFRATRPVAVAAVATTAVLTSLLLALPATDESLTWLGSVALVFLVLWSAAAVLLPRPWRPVAVAPMVLAAVPVLTLSALSLAQAALNALSVGDPFTRGAGVRLGDVDAVVSPALLVPLVLGLAVACLALAPTSAPTPASTSASPTARRRLAATDPLVGALAGALAVAVAATLALTPAPLWTVVAVLAGGGAALLADAVRRPGRRGAAEATGGALLAIGAVAVALPSDVLTTASLLPVVAGATALLLRGAFRGAEAAGAAALPAAVAGLVWAAGSVAGLETAHRAVPVLLAVGLLAIVRPRAELETSAALSGLLASLAAVAAAGTSTSLALHLTLAGALVTASALLHPSRRWLAWPGGALLAAATWVRLADLGVEAPEAYTLPSAVALVLVGLWRLRHDPEAASATVLAPGLVLATVPSLLWLLVTDPVSLRALLLGLGCLGLVLAGVRLRWNAPVAVGGPVGGLLVLRELAPYAAATPQWILIGLAGTLLTVVGITWESRMRDLHRGTAYLGRLR